MKIKEYLKIASTFYPYWDKEMADSLVQKFHLDIKQKLGKFLARKLTCRLDVR